MMMIRGNHILRRFLPVSSRHAPELGMIVTRYGSFLQSFSSSSSSSSSSVSYSSSPNEWRKKQLEHLEQKFKTNAMKQKTRTPCNDKTDTTTTTNVIVPKPSTAATIATTMDVQSEDELQPMWKEMEGRVTRRKLRTILETGGKTGRCNIRKTDEEYWLQGGLYNDNQPK